VYLVALVAGSSLPLHFHLRCLRENVEPGSLTALASDHRVVEDLVAAHFDQTSWKTSKDGEWRTPCESSPLPESFWTSTVHEAAEWLDAWTALSGIPPHVGGEVVLREVQEKLSSLPHPQLEEPRELGQRFGAAVLLQAFATPTLPSAVWLSGAAHAV